MSMYLPSDDVGPTGAEGAEFIDVPEPTPEDRDEDSTEDREVTPEADEAYGVEANPPGMDTDAGES